MRRLIRPSLFVLLLLCLRLPVIGKSHDSAKAAYAKGTDAEARQNYEQAYDYFKEAYNLKPKDLRYRTAFERTRFYAASSHVHRGQILRDAGKLEEAEVEFQKGLDIDPSSFIAQQELNRTKQLMRCYNPNFRYFLRLMPFAMLGPGFFGWPEDFCCDKSGRKTCSGKRKSGE